MAARYSESVDRAKKLRDKPLPDFSVERKSPKEKSPIQKVKEEVQQTKIAQYAEKSRKSKIGLSYTIYSDLYSTNGGNSPPKKTTRYDGSHPSDLLDETEDKFRRRAAGMDSPSKASSSPQHSVQSQRSPDKSRETRKLEARTNALESQTGSGMSEDAIMKRYDAISTRDAVPATQRQQELREKEARLLSRAGADESEASDMSNQERSDSLNFVTAPAVPAVPATGHRVPLRSRRAELMQQKSAASRAQSTLTLVMISLLPLLLYGCYRIVAQNIDPAQAQRLESFISGIETQV